MAEWPKAAVLKTVGRSRVPWVRILLPPPTFNGCSRPFFHKAVIILRNVFLGGDYVVTNIYLIINILLDNQLVIYYICSHVYR